jgi:hypothetical protein
MSKSFAEIGGFTFQHSILSTEKSFIPLGLCFGRFENSRRLNSPFGPMLAGLQLVHDRAPFARSLASKLPIFAWLSIKS